MHKFIFVVGGVMSGVGKGAATASLGRVLQEKGYKVTAIKIDPYINVDAGTMNPVEHGEVFVTVDGDETDQDVGNYERFLETSILSINYMTTGRVYQSVIQRERNLGYGGRTVQVVPDVPNEVIERIENATERANADFTLIEIGGTVGEYENILFLEAARLMRMKYPDQVRNILVSYMPVPGSLGEMKTKPTQQAVRTMMAAGMYPDFVIARSTLQIDEPRKKKLAMFSNVHAEQVIGSPDVKSIYEIPVVFEKQQFGDKILKSFGMKELPEKKLVKWKRLLASIVNTKGEVKIGVIGKYFSTGDFTLSDAYISVIEAIKHASWANGRTPKLVWLNSEAYEKSPAKLKELDDLDGVVIPGGFGSRGIEGKIKAIRYCRENKIPYLGLCYGMQCAVIEYARNVLKLKDANTTEINPKTKHPVIHLLPGQEEKMKEGSYGGTLRLGSYPCKLAANTTARKAYDEPQVDERHRHRYEFNNEYRAALEKAGLVISGVNPEQDLVEIVELKNHPFFVGVQFHPEFQSRPLSPHPLFKAFVKAAVGKKGRKG
ncbi:CTP synthase [Candidatus Uhrbacteria bacterium RIFCSPHIGHO2_02_FULL_47_44]|uniref:CTP synthase n=1 Tax=Candidatus Uhrbacteria bacterium RIFCSPLOWO2_02_FULL_48_18 TaxID=1802408 RepID=A0A1F7V984_9BACT|nr:MAG: CTP synthase [Candidatus Uhrbacteria bacterium RIFCSPHIGHO2_01_FULL_47_10]OGL71721.1 MAG: CTP synthase [Candidatus Uhrbacteria bacterium RIFCSPHIGHO2_02_FULL_47_44]OGL76199.1 MAG: CTP synthase [Candidatus Uhrbacteria bacterium RIFCSPHIGHO2_12_FULL_47_12]OGL81880.1 MAG: CTP synthase [Candidatus Uhrbacteria bacterium RIFCSPLOWO2_01_FULL_47_17]OGL87043.1 MAG: CTP synthase [Candidatus Uhrbacteria bacterium RIFCSPLOWO2_02_FULL_48_18]OGL92743.1 MAG: CTP synthase [Candidatus Uhrbacteria bacte